VTLEPPGNSNPRRTRQRFDSFRALAQASLAQASNANESPARRTSPNLTWGTPFGSLLYGVRQNHRLSSLERLCARSFAIDGPESFANSELPPRGVILSTDRLFHSAPQEKNEPTARLRGTRGGLRAWPKRTTFLQDEAARYHATFVQFAGLNGRRLAGCWITPSAIPDRVRTFPKYGTITGS
jgi:hypothetical protein